jgi:ComF family protein
VPLARDCLLCEKVTENGALCEGCWRDLPYANLSCCPLCAVPIWDGAVCGACLKRPPAFDQTIAALRYAHPADAMIQALKYGSRLEFVPVLGRALADRIADSPRPTLLIPVPLGAARLKKRGFNQALELAREISRRIGVRVDVGACSRIRETLPQTQLPYAERAKNIRGAFVCARDLSGERVAVLDDVMTTGVTLNEIARVLKRAGAEHVSAWVVARTVPP